MKIAKGIFSAEANRESGADVERAEDANSPIVWS